MVLFDFLMAFIGHPGVKLSENEIVVHWALIDSQQLFQLIIQKNCVISQLPMYCHNTTTYLLSVSGEAWSWAATVRE